MAHLHSILQSHPHPSQLDGSALAECIEACGACAQACTACADACLAEESVAELRRCIRLDLDCADLCAATGAVLARQTEPARALMRRQTDALAEICDACAFECEQHASMHEHCKVCGEACRLCAQRCRRLLETLPAAA